MAVTPAETAVLAAMVAGDEDAALRLEIHDMIRKIVAEEVTRAIAERMPSIGGTVIRDQQWIIRNLALAAIKQHFVNPGQINDYPTF